MRARVPTKYGSCAMVWVLVAAIALLGGCRPRPTGDQGGSAPSGKPVLRFASIWVNEPRKSTLEEVAAAFRAEHPEITLRIDYYQPDAYKSLIRTAVGAGDVPDVFFVWPGEWLRSFVRGGHVLDLSDELEKDGWGERFLPNAMPLFEYRGGIYGVPMLMQCAYFFYSKPMFAERGLAPPRTWDELLDICEVFRQSGIEPIGLSNVDKWPIHHYVTILWQRLVGEDQVLADYDRETGGAFADPGYLEGLRMVRYLAESGCFSAHPNGTTREAFRQLFATGQVPMIFTGTWDLGVLQDSPEVPPGFGETWDVFPFPEVPDGRGDHRYMMGAPDGYAVWAASPVKDQAITWLRYLTERQTAERLVTGLQELVCVKGAVNKRTAGERLQRYAADLESTPGVTPWADIMLEASVREVFLDSLQGMLDGTVTPEQVLDSLRAAHARARQRILLDEDVT